MSYPVASGDAPDSRLPTPDGSSPDSRLPARDGLFAALLAHAPRVAFAAGGTVWADARGLDPRRTAEALQQAARDAGFDEMRAAAAATPVAAEIAARYGTLMLTVIKPGNERAYLAPFAVGALARSASANGVGRRPSAVDRKKHVGRHPSAVDRKKHVGRHPSAVDRKSLTGEDAGTDPTPLDGEAGTADGRRPTDNEFSSADGLRPTADENRLLASLDALGVETCGQLAALDAESVEVRLGAEGMRLWRLARGEAMPWLFRAPLRALPHAELEWADYVLTDPERLLFVVNALAGTVCTALAAQGERAREASLHFRLASGARIAHVLRSARPSAEQRKWLRLARAALERLVLPDAVVGVELRIERVTGNDGAQGDLFDRGFASAGAVDEATADLLDDQGETLIVQPRNSAHPLLDQRTSWMPVSPADAARGPIATAKPGDAGPHLTLQLVTPARAITVETEPRRDHARPVRYRDDRGWHGLVESVGPERVSGGTWETPFAREYFRCVREDGVMVWMYRGGAEWYMQGWWD